MNALNNLDLRPFSRREFLHLAGRGLAGMFLLPLLEPGFHPLGSLAHLSESADTLLGRITTNKVILYDTPALDGKPIKTLWTDLVLPITRVTLGGQEPAHNRVWYELNHEGFAHSGAVQPVEIRLNSPVEDIPADGQLGEVTVPFTDAVWAPERPRPIAYRLHYSTTHWVKGLIRDEKGEPYYQILDDYTGKIYAVNARHLRLVPPDDLTTLSPEVPPKQKRVEVRLAEQVVIAYEDELPVFMTRAATGARMADGNYTTPTGRFTTRYKRPCRHMTNGSIANPFNFDLPGVPWVCFINDKGVSFHGTFWHNDFGRPRSHGCINLNSEAAHWLYRWTLPLVPPEKMVVYKDTGTIVDIV